MGNYIFGFFGALLRFVFLLFYNFLTKKEIKSFREVWFGPECDDFADEVSYEIVNTFLGLGVIVFLLLLLTGDISC